MSRAAKVPTRTVGVDDARKRDDHETHDREGRVAGDDRADPLRLKRAADEDDREQTTQPDRDEHEVQAEAGDGGVVACGAGRVPAERHRHQPDAGEDGHEEEQRAVAHGEAQHRQRRRDERCRQPGPPDRIVGEELAEQLAEGRIEAHRAQVEAEEGEERGGGGGDGPERGGARGEVERAVVLRPLVAQGEQAEHQGADRARGAEVDHQLRDREPVPHGRAGIGDKRNGGTASEAEGCHQGQQTDDQQERWPGDA